MVRGSDSQVKIKSSSVKKFYKKAVLKSSKNFTEKDLCVNLFLNKVAALQPETFFRKRLL